MSLTSKEFQDNGSDTNAFWAQEAFSRLDEEDDAVFYSRDRFVSHLDSSALATVENLIGDLIVEEEPLILDLMAGWDSHIPDRLHPARVVGLGLNRNELLENSRISKIVLHDLNKEPRLPFPDNEFDAVINTVSVDYMTRPIEVFKEVGRILKPGGLFLVIFSNRMFPGKAVKIWRESSEEERVRLVEEYFKRADVFEKTIVFSLKGKPRPRDDKYYSLTPLGDPIYAVSAEKKGEDPNRKPRSAGENRSETKMTREELQKKMKDIKTTLACPYCGEKMKKWAVPDNPFSQTWDNDFMYICFNDDCPYYVRGWDVLARQSISSGSYRLMYHPEKDCCLPIPVPTPTALKECIIN